VESTERAETRLGDEPAVTASQDAFAAAEKKEE
jgi:hypothetical protein